MEVNYEFDRSHENIPDSYWVKSEEEGVQMTFDERQQVKTIFLHVIEDEGFSPANLTESDIDIFSTKNEAAAYASKNHITTSEGQAELFGVERDWIRFEHAEYNVHGCDLNIM